MVLHAAIYAAIYVAALGLVVVGAILAAVRRVSVAGFSTAIACAIGLVVADRLLLTPEVLAASPSAEGVNLAAPALLQVLGLVVVSLALFGVGFFGLRKL